MTEHITIGDIAPRIQYTADGAQTVFTYPFPVFAGADLEVYLGESLQASGYTVSGAGESDGGDITFDTAPANATTVTLRRRITAERTTDFQEGGAFRAKTINDELDRLIAVAQEIRDDIGRVIRLAPTDPDAAIELPAAADRAGNYMAFDGSGGLIAAAPPASGTAVSAYMATVLDDTDAAVARTTLGLGTAATLAAGTAANNAVQLDGSARLPAVDASLLTDLPGNADAAARLMSTVNAFRIAANGAISVQNFEDGFVDEFEDQSGVSADVTAAIAQGTGTEIGDLTGGGGLAVAFDGTKHHAAGSGPLKNSTASGYIGKDLGAGNAKALASCTIFGPTNTGFGDRGGTATATLYGSNSAPANPTDGTAISAATNVSETATNQVVEIASTDTATAYRYLWVTFIPSSTGSVYVSEIELTEQVSTGDSTNQTYDPTTDTYAGLVDVFAGPINDTLQGTNSYDIDGTRPYAGIKFDPAADADVVAVVVDVQGVDSAGDFMAHIYEHANATPLGTSATLNIAATGIARFEFAAPVSISPGTDYVIEVERVSGDIKIGYVTPPGEDTEFSSVGAGRTHSITSDSNASGDFRFGWVSQIAVDMTLVSNSQTADTAPGDASLTLFIEDVDSITLNSDLKAWASRDDGTTWTQITLVSEFEIAHEGATLCVLTGTANISGQPSGTAMKWKITTHNTKEVRVHGVSLAWS